MADEVVAPVVAPVIETVVTPEGGTAWHSGFDAETRGYLENHGWDKLTPQAAALEASKAHREAEKFLGVPKDQLLRLAPATDEAGYNAMWQRLGAQDAAAKYDFSNVKVGDKPLDAGLVAALQEGALAGKVPLTAAQAIAASLAKYEGARATEKYEETQRTLTANKEALAKQWGPNMDANLFVAKSAAQKLGVAPEAVAALENSIGYDKTMEMFRKIGEQMGEAKFVTNQLLPGSQVFTRDQAIARKAELMNDKDWTTAYLNGDAAKNREMTGLLRIITGEDETTYQAA